jgi:hypothetical protein
MRISCHYQVLMVIMRDVPVCHLTSLQWSCRNADSATRWNNVRILIHVRSSEDSLTFFHCQANSATWRSRPWYQAVPYNKLSDADRYHYVICRNPPSARIDPMKAILCALTLLAATWLRKRRRCKARARTAARRVMTLILFQAIVQSITSPLDRLLRRRPRSVGR